MRTGGCLCGAVRYTRPRRAVPRRTLPLRRLPKAVGQRVHDLRAVAARGLRVDRRVRDLRPRQLLPALRLAAVSPRRGGRRDPARLARRRAVRATAAGGDLDQAPRAVDPPGRRRLAASREPALVVHKPLKSRKSRHSSSMRRKRRASPIARSGSSRARAVTGGCRRGSQPRHGAARARRTRSRGSRRRRRSRAPGRCAVVDPVARSSRSARPPGRCAEEVDRAGDAAAFEDRQRWKPCSAARSSSRRAGLPR